MTKKRATGGSIKSDVPYGGMEGEKETVIPYDADMLRVFASSASLKHDPNIVTLSLPRQMVEQILGGIMSAISKRAYGSHWITGTETSLPFVVGKTLDTYSKDGGAYTWGQSGVTGEEAQTLYALAQTLGYWVIWDEAEKVYKPYLG